jgi:hypothetical protein
VDHKFAKLFSDPDAYATCLLQALADMYGLPPATSLEQDVEIDWDFLRWEPETMEAELTRDLGGRPPDEVLTKIQAACGLLATDVFHGNVHAFCAVCQALSRGIPMTEAFVPAGLMDMAWGVMEANMLEGPGFWDPGFVEDVRRYAGLVLDNHGVYDPPPILSFAIYPADRKATMLANLEGDPDMYRLALDHQREEKDAIQAMLNSRTAELVTQWMSLPIPYLNREGDAARLLEIVA